VSDYGSSYWPGEGQIVDLELLADADSPHRPAGNRSPFLGSPAQVAGMIGGLGRALVGSKLFVPRRRVGLVARPKALATSWQGPSRS
jgi:hypothetical protein